MSNFYFYSLILNLLVRQMTAFEVACQNKPFEHCSLLCSNKTCPLRSEKCDYNHHCSDRKPLSDVLVFHCLEKAASTTFMTFSKRMAEMHGISINVVRLSYFSMGNILRRKQNWVCNQV